MIPVTMFNNRQSSRTACKQTSRHPPNKRRRNRVSTRMQGKRRDFCPERQSQEPFLAVPNSAFDGSVEGAVVLISTLASSIRGATQSLRGEEVATREKASTGFWGSPVIACHRLKKDACAQREAQLSDKMPRSGMVRKGLNHGHRISPGGDLANSSPPPGTFALS